MGSSQKNTPEWPGVCHYIQCQPEFPKYPGFRVPNPRQFGFLNEWNWAARYYSRAVAERLSGNLQWEGFHSNLLSAGDPKAEDGRFRFWDFPDYRRAAVGAGDNKLVPLR